MIDWVTSGNVRTEGACEKSSQGGNKLIERLGTQTWLSSSKNYNGGNSLDNNLLGFILFVGYCYLSSITFI